MFTLGWSNARTLRELTSGLREEVQRLATELAELRAQALALDNPDALAALAARVDEARLSSQRELDRFLAGTHHAAETATSLGAALEGFFAALRKGAPRGRAGGKARIRSALCYSDGTFVPNEEAERLLEELELEEYERRAAGGRARASRARRAIDGTFLTDRDSSRAGETANPK
jgi:hypothetical protein